MSTNSSTFSDFRRNPLLSRSRGRRARGHAAPPNPSRHLSRPPYRDQGTQTDPEPPDEQESIAILSPRDRVDWIVKYLREKHRWSPRKFLKHYVTEGSLLGGESPETRARRLAEAIFEQPEVEEALLVQCAQGPLQRLLSEPLSQRIQRELEALINGRLGSFRAEQPVEELQLERLVEDIQSQAPILWQFLVGLVEQRNYREARDISDSHSMILMICGILAHARAPRKSTWFQALLGIHLYSMGVKRRCISVLANLGVTLSYDRINRLRAELEEHGRVSEFI